MEAAREAEALIRGHTAQMADAADENKKKHSASSASMAASILSSAIAQLLNSLYADARGSVMRVVRKATAAFGDFAWQIAGAVCAAKRWKKSMLTIWWALS